jgi:hypothetical protein
MKHAPRTALLSTLAGARRLRRGVALLACLAVFSWTLLAVTHLHDHADAGKPGDAGPACELCMGMPVGATPPQHSVFAGLLPRVSATLTPDSPVAPVAGVPSSYLSRGPPTV